MDPFFSKSWKVSYRSPLSGFIRDTCIPFSRKVGQPIAVPPFSRSSEIRAALFPEQKRGDPKGMHVFGVGPERGARLRGGGGDALAELTPPSPPPSVQDYRIPDPGREIG